MSAPSAPPPWHVRLERWALTAALAAALGLALAALPARGVYLARLADAPGALARGALAADENVSPLATAGQVRWRAELARQRERGTRRPSGLALAWSFYARERTRVAPGARVYLARPDDALYQLGNFLWFPARLEVAPEVSTPLADGADLVRASARRGCADHRWLAEAGYSACVEATGRELRLVDIPGAAR